LGLFVFLGACSASTGVAPMVETSAPAVAASFSVAPTAAAERVARDADEGTAPLLVVGHQWARGFLTLVLIYRQASGEYLLVSDRAPEGACHLRRWRNVSAADTATFNRWFTILDPNRLGENDECQKSVRDGSSWIVGARGEGGWVWRSRQQNGVDSPTCREFAGACSGIMALLDMSCRGPAGEPKATPSNMTAGEPQATPSNMTAGEPQATPSNMTAGGPKAAPSNMTGCFTGDEREHGFSCPQR
jgi:hypothetical protein